MEFLDRSHNTKQYQYIQKSEGKYKHNEEGNRMHVLKAQSETRSWKIKNTRLGLIAVQKLA